MFGVLIESRAKRQRRAGGALLSIIAHTALLSLAVVLTAQGAPRIVDQPPPPPPMVWIPVAPTGTAHTSTRSSASRTVPCACVPLPPGPVFTFDVAIPATNVSVASEGAHVADVSLWGDPKPLVTFAIDSGARAGSSWSSTETSARMLHAVRPRYPEMLRAAGISGRVIVHFVVDTAGRVGPMTIVSSTHDLFSRAVRDVMPTMRLIPAEVGGRRVPVLAEMAFEFALDRR